MQPVERGMDENVAVAAGFERRGKAHMAEPHGRDSREGGGPRLKRPGNQGVQVIDIYWISLIPHQ
jgi:hypothetical protein